jgi:hypothetical protein
MADEVLSNRGSLSVDHRSFLECLASSNSGVSGSVMVRCDIKCEPRAVRSGLPTLRAIMDFDKSLEYDIELLRSSPAVPKHVKL